MPQLVRFEMNVPTELALAGPGKPVEGRYGDRVMYTLTDNRVMYVAPIVAHQIVNLGIQPGEIFRICKCNRREGQRRVIEWQVDRLEFLPDASDSDTKLEQQLEESIEAAEAAKAVRVLRSTDVPAASSAALEIAASAPDDHRAAEAPTGSTQAMPTPQSPAAAVTTSATPPVGQNNGASLPAKQNGTGPSAPTTKLEHALKTAISAAYNAEKYGAELGYVVRFDADAIKSMAITVLINMSEAGRR
jgi:hypothetical protein